MLYKQIFYPGYKKDFAEKIQEKITDDQPFFSTITKSFFYFYLFFSLLCVFVFFYYLF
jgi:hypothetical protein